MYKVVIIGGGWSGCAAALAARKAGAEVTLLEKTDMLLGLGNVGGIMRNNGRFTAAEENIALGARELFDITDRCSRHVNIDFPGHKHASLYDVMKVEPNVRRLLREKGVDVRLMLPGKPDHWYADCVAESYFGELIKHGVKVYRYTPGFLHGKSIMVDREAAFVGSANMDYRSFELDYECGVMVYSVPMIESLLEDMDMIVDHSHLVTAEEWAKRSVLRRVFEPLLRLFAIWM